MFLPSFFTGHLITRFGVEKIISAGLVILLCAGIVALSGVALPNFFFALLLLGIGWNFGFIGATTMFTGAHAPHERGVAQGMNDMIVFGMVTVASLGVGRLDELLWRVTAVEGWTAVNIRDGAVLGAGGRCVGLAESCQPVSQPQ